MGVELLQKIGIHTINILVYSYGIKFYILDRLALFHH